ncbi:MAG: hypothetical protein M3Y87_07270 [Myxococcota bacterium]|nr:hypothetical protein [Myxococcota bacterium]
MRRHALGRSIRNTTVAAALALASCTEPSAVADAGMDAIVADAGPTPPPWPRGLPDLGALGERRGRTLARAIVHVHSPLSHDACDGEGFADGVLLDTECLDHFRDAACTLRMDALMVTDHAPHVNEVSLESALWMRDGDEAVRDGDGNVIASRIACPDGHRVLITVGSENELMAVGLLRHPGDPADPEALGAIYEADGAAAADVFRAAGGLALYAHTEGHSLEQLRATRPDGVEIYNTHANVDPDIRRDQLGLEPFDYAPLLLRFTVAANGLEPDLSLLSFLSENGNALAKWDTLLAEGARLTGTGGCDAHENTFTQRMPDGERGDSYRRMMLWHTHHVLVGARDRDGVMEALDAGRLYLTFEVFGTPVGFDFVAEDEGGAIAEMGDDSAVGATLRVVRPALPEGFPADPPPALRMRILRAAEGGAVEVASGDGATLEHVITEAGAYRAEVRMIPEHARPYLGRFADELIREVVWVYSNPIYVPAAPTP